MANTGTATYDAEIEELNGMKRLVVSWTSHASTGLVEKTIGLPIGGYVSKLVTIPGSPAPDVDYDVTWEDDQGVDMLLGLGVNRHTSATETEAIQMSNGLPVPVYTPKHVFKVANAGNSKQGTSILTWR